MAKEATYLKSIKEQVKACHNGKVPTELLLTIQRYAKALELCDYYREQMMKDGPIIWEQGSTKQMTRKQHPLCNLIYQQENLCQTYAKMLGLTAAKAAVKPDAPDKPDEDDQFISTLKAARETLDI